MSNKISKEVFSKGFDSNNAPLLLDSGEIAGGENLRAVGSRGGWKGRKGCTLRNTTAAGSAVVEAIPYENPVSDYFRVLYHYGDYFYAGAAPLTQAAGLGSTLGLDIGASVGSSCMIGEQLYYANGEERPSVYSGDAIACRGFVVNDNVVWSDFTKEVVDQKTTTHGRMLFTNGVGTDAIYVCGHEKMSAILITLGTAYNVIDTTTIVVSAWRSGAWAATAALSDGTTAGTTTFRQSGTISWTASDLDEMKVIAGTMGYWYKITCANTTSAIHITDCKVTSPFSFMTNKWDGIYGYSAGALFYDFTGTVYYEGLGAVSNESEATYLDIGAGTSSDFLYIKGTSPLAGVGIGLVTGKENIIASVIDDVEVWEDTGWSSIAGIDDGTSDGTSSFHQSGQIFWDFSSVTPVRRSFNSDNLAGYWYRISWDVTLTNEVQIYLIVVALAPTEISYASGCVEFDSRLMLWGDPLYRNRLKYSTKGKPDNIGSSSSGYTGIFGKGDEVTVAKSFSEYLLVGKETGVYLLAKSFDIKKVTSEVGIVSPDTLQIVEVGTSNMQKELIINVAIWLDADGVYQYDMEGVAKISLPIDNYFNSNSSDYLTIAAIAAAKSFIDQERNEYHLLIGSTELVYNYAYQKWYPPWDREISLLNGVSFRADDKAFYSLGMSTSGFVMELENATSDRSVTNVATPITQMIRTRVLTSDENGLSIFFNLRHIWLVVKSDISAYITDLTVNLYKNFSLTPSTIDTINLNVANVTYTIIKIDVSETDCTAFEILCTIGQVNRTFEIHEIIYEYEQRSIILS